MSRIGKAPIKVPQGVTVDINGLDIKVKGPKGERTRTFRPEIEFKREDDVIYVLRRNEDRLTRGLHGLSRTLLANMVTGLSEWFTRKLEVIGVGYRAVVEGKKLTMQLGYSHPVEIEIPKDITVEVGKGNVITITGVDKQELGDFASFVRGKRPPEVYKGKGVKYEGEVIRKKAGKAAGAK
ncbi:MAG: 50S ribosomal protein L6 [Candidatus Obscuribacterales bacterium]|nr:50S ribosomal protein L6 [Candidatus Obscuribacterales bacterium]